MSGKDSAQRELAGLLGTKSVQSQISLGVVTSLSPFMVRLPGKQVVVASDGSLTLTDPTPVSVTVWTDATFALNDKVLLARLPNLDAWACIGGGRAVAGWELIGGGEVRQDFATFTTNALPFDAADGDLFVVFVSVVLDPGGPSLTGVHVSGGPAYNQAAGQFRTSDGQLSVGEYWHSYVAGESHDIGFTFSTPSWFAANPGLDHQLTFTMFRVHGLVPIALAPFGNPFRAGSSGSISLPPAVASRFTKTAGDQEIVFAAFMGSNLATLGQPDDGGSGFDPSFNATRGDIPYEAPVDGTFSGHSIVVGIPAVTGGPTGTRHYPSASGSFTEAVSVIFAAIPA